MTFRRFAAGQSRDLGSLQAIDQDRTTRAWRVFQALEALLFVFIAPGRDRHLVDPECLGDTRQRLAAIEFE